VNVITVFSSIAAALLLGLSVSAAEVPADETRASKPAFKGMELYSWLDPASREWKFSLLPGTNRQKTETEIKSAATALDTIEKLEAKLGQLAPKEYVTWNAHVDSKQFVLPPAELIKRVDEYVKQKQITLVHKSPPEH
jgi:hypothetical protein